MLLLDYVQIPLNSRRLPNVIATFFTKASVLPMRMATITACVIAGGILGCNHDVTGPVLPRGTFALVSIDGRPLPILGTQSDTTSGTLSFTTGGTVIGVISSIGHAAQGQPPLSVDAVTEYSAVQAGGIIELRSITTGVLDTASVTGTGLDVRAHLAQSSLVQVRRYTP